MVKQAILAALLALGAASPKAPPPVLDVRTLAPLEVPPSKTSAQCRIENVWNHQYPWVVPWGDWCIQDEITGYFDLPHEACLGGCATGDHELLIHSAQIGFLVTPYCTGGWPATTLPFEGRAVLYAVDPAMEGPDCTGGPAAEPFCMSPVQTIPPQTASSWQDPRIYHVEEFEFPVCCVEMQPLFLAFEWVGIPPEALPQWCNQGGTTTCGFLIPVMLGRNWNNFQPIASPCTQWYRNESIWGPDWFESLTAGFNRMSEVSFWLNASCTSCAVGVQKTTWGKLKSLNR